MNSNEINALAKIALEEMDKDMVFTKRLSSHDDIEICKTYIRAINLYIPTLTPWELQCYLERNLSWTNNNAKDAGDLLNRLKQGKTFRGGNRYLLGNLYAKWMDKLNEECTS